MKIKSIETFRLVLPPKQPSTKSRRTNYNSRVKRAHPINKYPEFPRSQGKIPGQSTKEIWVKITAENGVYGLGNSRGWAEVLDLFIRQHFVPLLLGRDCFATDFLNDLMWRMSHRAGPAGIATLARSVMDLALWDLKGKLLEKPVYSLLGGPSRDAVTYYCTGDDIDWAMELGFTGFKLSNPVFHEEGTQGLNILEDKIAKAREMVGPNAELMLNPTGSYNVEFAARVMERLKPYGLRWLEEPLMNHDIAGLVELKRAVPTVPIATGEGLQGRHIFRELVERRCVDILQPDIRICGGLTEAIKIYTIGESAGLATIVHAGFTAAGQHYSFAMPECPMAEYWLGSDPGVPLEETHRIPGVPVPVNGRLVPSDAPGFGFEILECQLMPLGS